MSEQSDKKKPDREDIEKTIAVSPKALSRRKSRSVGEDKMRETHEVLRITLRIRGMAEHVALREDTPVLMGRADVKSGFYPDINLMPYGAKERGVSREHAHLRLNEGNVYVTDLGSANGTFVENQQINPNQPHRLRDGEEFFLGQLAVQIIYGDDD